MENCLKSLFSCAWRGHKCFGLEENLKAVWSGYKYEGNKYCAILLTVSFMTLDAIKHEIGHDPLVCFVWNPLITSGTLVSQTLV